MKFHVRSDTHHEFQRAFRPSLAPTASEIRLRFGSTGTRMPAWIRWSTAPAWSPTNAVIRMRMYPGSIQILWSRCMMRNRYNYRATKPIHWISVIV